MGGLPPSLAGIWFNSRILPTQEHPSGTVDGVNTLFTLSYIAMPGTLKLFVNGIFQTPNIAYTYNEAAATVTLAVAPPIGAAIYADYLH